MNIGVINQGLQAAEQGQRMQPALHDQMRVAAAVHREMRATMHTTSTWSVAAVLGGIALCFVPGGQVGGGIAIAGGMTGIIGGEVVVRRGRRVERAASMRYRERTPE